MQRRAKSQLLIAWAFGLNIARDIFANYLYLHINNKLPALPWFANYSSL